MNPPNGSPEFTSPLSTDSLLHSMIKGIIRSISENKQSTDKTLDKITEDVSEIRSTVDKLGIDHIFSDIAKQDEKIKGHDIRIQKVENYHNRILGVVGVAGFMLALAAVAVNLLK